MKKLIPFCVIACLIPVSCGGGSGSGGGPAELVAVLKKTPPTMMFMYANAETMKYLDNMGMSARDMGKGMEEYGIKPEQVKTITIGVDIAKMFKGEGGTYSLMEGDFKAADVGKSLEKNKYGKSGEKNGFVLYKKRQANQLLAVAVKDGVMLSGMEPDIRRGMALLAGSGTSMYESKGVKEAVGYLRHGELAVVITIPENSEAKPSADKKYQTEAMAMSFGKIDKDGNASGDVVLVCPTEEDAEKAEADMKKQYEEKGKDSKVKLITIKRDGRVVHISVEGALKELMRQGK